MIINAIATAEEFSVEAQNTICSVSGLFNQIGDLAPILTELRNTVQRYMHSLDGGGSRPVYAWIIRMRLKDGEIDQDTVFPVRLLTEEEDPQGVSLITWRHPELGETPDALSALETVLFYSKPGRPGDDHASDAEILQSEGFHRWRGSRQNHTDLAGRSVQPERFDVDLTDTDTPD
jgi:hypothetical protein